jgi:hypothetical protein
MTNLVAVAAASEKDRVVNEIPARGAAQAAPWALCIRSACIPAIAAPLANTAREITVRIDRAND